MMKWLSRLLPLLLSLAACDNTELPPPRPVHTGENLENSAPPKPAKIYERVILSDVYEVDRIYKSMMGPHSTEEFKLEDLTEPELLWIVGFEAIMVDPEGTAQVSQEFMCHANLDIDAVHHSKVFDQQKLTTGRLFTLSQGQYRIDMPLGTGIPVLSTEALMLNTQVLNLNDKDAKHRVRHKVVMRYLRDKEVEHAMKPLYVAGAYGLKLLEGKDGHYGRPDTPPASASAKEGHEHHEGHDMDHSECLPGKNAAETVFDDNAGRKFTGHWVVEPGHEVNHTNVTKLMDLPFDTTMHYVAVHLHPFAEKLTLKDLTTGQVVYEAKTRQAGKGIGLEHVDFFASEKGVPLFKDHQYEIISVYHNTSGEPQDSMAVMNLYVIDKEFKKPDLRKVAQETPPPASSSDRSSPKM